MAVPLDAAAAPPAPARDHDIGVDDYFSLAAVLSVATSPDGQNTAYVDLRWEPDSKKRNGDIWVTSSRGTSQRLTFDPGFDAHPTWSPDGSWLYFDSPRGGKKQVWRIHPDGSGLMQVTRKAGGIKSYRLSGDGQTIYYVRSVKTTAEPWRALKQKHSKLQYGHGVVKASEIRTLDLNTWRDQQLIKASRVLVDFDVTHDQSRIALVTRPTNELITNEGWSTVDIYEMASGKMWSLADKQWRQDAPSPYGWLDAVSWSHDGKSLAFTVDFDGYPTQLRLARFKGAGDQSPTLTQLAQPTGVTVNGGAKPVWRGRSNDLLFRGEQNARARIYQIEDANRDKPGAAHAVTAGDVVVGAMSVGSDSPRDVTFVMSSPSQFGNVFAVKVGKNKSKFARLTDINPHTTTWKLPSMQSITWKGTDGVQVQGVLSLPPGYDGKKPLPTLVVIHGGPASSAKMRLRFWGYGRTLMAAKGYAVLSPNYRGSTGFGDKFLVDLIGRKNDIDVTDILSGVDALVAKGTADPDKLGVMGWSNGGYLTNCIVTHTQRFKAGSSGAGVFDVAMQWAIEDTPGHVVNYQKGLPWDKAEGMRKASPMYDVAKVKTPLLIHVGENDPRVPAEHSRALHRALHHYLKVPAELIVYPGEGHSLSKYHHRRAKMTWDLAWFEHYLLGKPLTH